VDDLQETYEPPMKRPITQRLLLSFLVFIWSALAHAQKPTEFRHTLHFSGPLDNLQAKTLIEALLAQDPAIQQWVGVGAADATTHGLVELNTDELNAALMPSGATIVTHDVLAIRADGTMDDGLPPSFPVMPNTGDPEADQANYAAAKAAWIQAHPQEYQQLIAPK
jgi:hypothetical protein